MEKTCLYCKIEKDISAFPKHKQNKDRLDNRCKECIKEQTQIRKKLHKSAPVKPQLCECCRKVPIKWVLDHDHSDNSFRGWICDQCNTGIGRLGDNLDGVILAVNYLLRYKLQKCSTKN